MVNRKIPNDGAQKYWEYYDDAIKYARKIIKNDHDVEDVVQNALTKVLVTDADGHVADKKAYLLVAVRTACMDYFKKKNPQQLDHEIEELSNLGEAPDIEESIDNEHQYQQVMRFIRDFSPTNKQIIELWMLQKLSDQEIADQLGIPVGTVHTRKARAKAELKRLLLQRGKDSGDSAVA